MCIGSRAYSTQKTTVRDFDSSIDGKPTQENVVLHELKQAKENGRSDWQLRYAYEDASGRQVYNMASIRRAIVGLRAKGHNISPARNGNYRLL